MSSASSDTGPAMAFGGRLAAWRERVMRFALGVSSLTLLDQVIFSGTSFAITVVLGRWAGPESLGVYALVFAVANMVLSIHESLVCLPYAIEFRKLPRRSAKAYAGSSLVQSTGLAALVTPILLVGGLTAWWTPIAGTSLGSALSIFALTVPAITLRDFARRYSLAHLRPHVSVIIDGAVSLLQLSMMAALAVAGWLSAWTALAVLGVGAAVVSAAWLIAARPQFDFRRRRYRRDLDRNWKLGRWVFSSQVCSVFTVYTPHWLIAAMLGTSATGIFVGCIAVVMLTNPFILGVHNMLSPKISHGIAQEGARGIGKVVLQSTLFLLGVMVLFLIAIAVGGEQFTTSIYGAEFAGYHSTTVVYALSTLCSSLGMPTDRALWATHHPKISFVTGLIGLLVTLATVYAMLPVWGILGGAAGLLLGNLTATVLRWIAMFRLGLVREVACD